MAISTIDRPLVPPVMAVLWYLGIIPVPLALLFAVQDFGGSLDVIRMASGVARATIDAGLGPAQRLAECLLDSVE